MATETRSLWEQLDSEVEPWRRGRSFLISFGAFQFVMQLFLLMITAFAVNIEGTAGVAVGCVIFWFLFYLVWIGVRWVRWLWGGWNLVEGFCLIIWGLRDSNNAQLLFGSLTFIIGFILCFSSSIHFFALRQRETVRWLEAVLMAGVCLVLLSSIAVAIVLLVGVRETWKRDATVFAMEANHRIYQDYDSEWVTARLNPISVQNFGEQRLKNFFWNNRVQIGRAKSFDEPQSHILMRLTWPPDLVGTVRIDCRAQTLGGVVMTHEIIDGRRDDWRLTRMWWDFVPLGQ